MIDRPSAIPLDINAWATARTVVVVAHPDDEVLGCGALLRHLRTVRVVHVTDGAPRHGSDAARLGYADSPTYAAARRQELKAALALADVGPAQQSSLGFHDQDVSLTLPAVAEALVPLFADADRILTHSFEGGHADHDAVAFAVQAAIRLTAHSPEVIEMPFYYGSDDGWSRQRFLPQTGAGPAMTFRLSDADRAVKARMIAAHRSQAETLRLFGLDQELFRRAPVYDFAVRPHAGPLLYERHGWNLTWPDWLQRIAEADVRLGRREARCR